MTYQPHWLLSWGGSLPGGEIWTNGIRMQAPGGMTWGEEVSDPLAAIDDFESDIRTLMTQGGSPYSNIAPCEWIKFNPIDANGRYADTGTTYAKYLTPAEHITPGVTAAVPHFVAMCITFTTAKQRGRASKGRLFVPAPSKAPSNATGRFSAADCQSAADAFATFINNINNYPGFDPANSPNASVMSNLGAPGESERITGVRVGDVPDFQSRRKNALVETYTDALVAIA